MLEEVNFQKKIVNPWKDVGGKKKKRVWILVTLFSCKRKQSVFYRLPHNEEGMGKEDPNGKKTVTGADF